MSPDKISLQQGRDGHGGRGQLGFCPSIPVLLISDLRFFQMRMCWIPGSHPVSFPSPSLAGPIRYLLE